MMDAYQEVEQLAETVRKYGNNSAGIAALDELLVKCRGYMEADQALPCNWLNSTPSRRQIFNLLLKRRGQTVSRSAMLDVCYSKAESDPSDKLIDVHICKLRENLIGTPYENMIETVWGTGFRLRPEAEGQLIPNLVRGKTNAARFYQSGIAA